MRPLAAYLFLLSCAWLQAAHAGPPDITVTDAWVRAVPGSDVAAAYFTASNTGTRPAAIISIRSPVAASAMIHETTLVGMQSTMRPHEQLSLAPNQTVHLTPGGLHVMLMGLTHALNPGDQVSLVLLLEGGATITIAARVRALSEP
jgi:periplasmic copper chaperone A